ncbi:MAG TPA: hypothetical protein VN861_03440 [Candidatus Acidoferrales bacterium]|nr:hypothetical protein [Candidatus Acidoferrales bacterium]
MTALARAQMARLAAEIEQSMPVKEWDSIPELKRFKQRIKLKDGEKLLTFDQMVDKVTDIQNEIKFRNGILKELKEALVTALDVAGEEHVTCIGYPVNIVEKKGSRRVDAKKLLEKGVSAMVIAECMKTGKGSRYVQVGKPDEDEL